ncbi:antirepressor, partial [Avibacterium paragallinarum]
MTNSNLITIFNGLIADQTIQLCNARDLHSFLGVG